VTDREKWKDIVRQAKAHGGLWCQWKKKIICNKKGFFRGGRDCNLNEKRQLGKPRHR
jgi:hypothetical protein